MPSSNHSSGGRSNNQLNDPYTKRDSYKSNNAYKANDPYKTSDPYRTHDPFDRRDPYEKNDEERQEEREKPCSFWFTCKMKMQDIYSTDSGAQAEGRVFNTDTDPFILQFFVKMSVMGFKSLFFVPLIMTLFFIGAIYANAELLMVILVVEFLYIAYILYCPAWQTFSSGQYAITQTGEDFYNKWRKGYLGYEGTTIFSFVLSVLGIGLLASHPYPFVFVYDYFDFDFPPTKDFVNATLFVVISSAVFLVLYFVLGYVLKKKDKENRRINKRMNIDMRTKSILGQLNAMMDSSEH